MYTRYEGAAVWLDATDDPAPATRPHRPPPSESFGQPALSAVGWDIASASDWQGMAYSRSVSATVYGVNGCQPVMY